MRIQTRTNVVCWRLYPIQSRSEFTEPLEFRSEGQAEKYLRPEDLKHRLSYVELVSLARAQSLFAGLSRGDLTTNQEAWFRLLGDQRNFRANIPSPLYSIGRSWGTFAARPFGAQAPVVPEVPDRLRTSSAPEGGRAPATVLRIPAAIRIRPETGHEKAPAIALAVPAVRVQVEEVAAAPVLVAPAAAPVIPGLVRWTPEQDLVIGAEANSRLLVDAGPGTGKTATACARIAWLITHGEVEASQIWLVSFTRTAVHELRNRIASYLESPADVAALRIATIDSQAWSIQSGFDSEASLTGTFEDNIKRVIELVQCHEGVFSYLSTIRHLVVDEAQDVIGARCELLLELIHALPQETGISIFSDEAQAIYGFAEESDDCQVKGTLPDNIRLFLADQFTERNLEQVHRTGDPKLLEIFRDGRSLIRSRMAGAERFKAILELVKKTNHGVLGPYWEDMKQIALGARDTLLLFRSRGTALAASGNMGTQPHRLRMSGLPTCIDGWIAELLWDWTQPDLDADEFERLWGERLGCTTDGRAQTAWSLLVRAFGSSRTRISVTRMVQRLAGGSPTYELTSPEYGNAGPIISTIHASKGREAAEVRLFLPRASDKGEDDNLHEEARVAFVGATRARSTLRIGEANHFSRSLKSGRAWTFVRSKQDAKANVEIGRVRDIDAVGLVGKGLYPTVADAFEAQARILAFKSGVTAAFAESTNERLEWRYRIVAEESGQHLCYLNTVVNNDLFAVAREVNDLVHLGRKRPPGRIRHLRIFGVRTLAIAPDDPVRELLHAPWRDSGLLAAPMLIGYSMSYFR